MDDIERKPPLVYSTNLENFKKRLDKFRFNSYHLLYGPVDNEMVREIIEDNITTNNNAIILEEKLSRLEYENAILKRKLEEIASEQNKQNTTKDNDVNSEIGENLQDDDISKQNFESGATSNCNPVLAIAETKMKISHSTKELKYTRKIIKGLRVLRELNKKRK